MKTENNLTSNSEEIAALIPDRQKVLSDSSPVNLNTTKSHDEYPCITEESEKFNESDLEDCREFIQTLYAKIKRGPQQTGTV